MAAIHNEIKSIIIKFRQQLDLILGDKLYGLYLYGSTARGEFEPAASDIDSIVVLKEPLIEEQIDKLKNLHEILGNKYKYGKKLDVMYLQYSDIGKRNNEIEKYTYVYNAELQTSGYFDINYITWWSLKHNGIPINSPDITHQLKDILWGQVVMTLDYNLNGYWKQKMDEETLFYEDYWVEFAISTLSRILYSLEKEKIISKTHACHYISDHYDEWDDVIVEALRIRTKVCINAFMGLDQRKERVLSFMKFVIDKGNRLLLEKVV